MSTCRRRRVTAGRELRCGTAADNAQQQHYESNHEQNMNEAAHSIGSDEAEQPKDAESDCDCIQHGEFPFFRMSKNYVWMIEPRPGLVVCAQFAADDSHAVTRVPR